jgi:hypothetical protein
MLNTQWNINKTLRQRHAFNLWFKKYNNICSELNSYETKKAKTAFYKSGLGYIPTPKEKNRLNRLSYLKKFKRKLENLLKL